ncbi:DNA-binding protein [Nocardioides seonyuensis]|uniref:DNA-binding protein n=1 Tax=Nocardioides seonyuensis TaxID=2518371 RepID=A0A4P7IKC4_9ACTN|nr:helix-turn-helix domain-containing protein [Nocardioides seonyuensis]QBX57313.1 DNA-binding protein [Nocardioides seonyuensis]
MAPNDLLTMKQVAAELGLSHSKATSLVTKGLLAVVARRGGAATWRVSRSDLDAYVERVRQESLRDTRRRNERRRSEALVALTSAWSSMPAQDQDRLRELAPDLYRPLAKLVQARPREAALTELAAAYARLTEDGVIELALALPHDLHWAIARIRCAS